MPPANERLATIEALMGEQNQKLDLIYDCVQKTNGRVNAHDVWISTHQYQAQTDSTALRELQKQVSGHQTLLQKAKGAWIVLACGSAIVGSLFEIIVKRLER